MTCSSSGAHYLNVNLAGDYNFPAIRLALVGWWRQHGRLFPWRQTRDPYVYFLVERLMRLTPAHRAEGAFRVLIKRYPTVEALAAAPVREVEEPLRCLGLKGRAAQTCEAARIVVMRFGGKIPCDRDLLKSLPGIGDYSANAILCLAYEQPVPLVDSPIARLICRVFALQVKRCPSADPTVWKAAKELMDKDNPVEYHHALLDVSETICCPGKPKCSICPIGAWCAVGSSA